MNTPNQKHTPYFELLEALAAPGCAVCRQAAASVSRYLDSVAYEMVTDVDMRRRLRASEGLCQRHGLQFLGETRDPLGLAIINQDLLRQLMEDTEEKLAPADTARGWLSRWIGPARQGGAGGGTVAENACPACELQAEAELRFAGALGDYLKQPVVQEAVGAADLCLPHIRMATSSTRDPQARKVLLACAERQLRSLEAELAEYVRKSDYRYRHEKLDTERDAPLRSQQFLHGLSHSQTT